VSTAAAEVLVPFHDLSAIHASITSDVLQDFERIIASGTFGNGEDVRQFEEAFASYVGTKACIGTSNGLDALTIALLAAGLEPGDRVLVPANTFVASVEAITHPGGVPVLVDASEDDLNIDPVLAHEAAAGTGARFLLPVHLYGQLAHMRELTRVASDAGLTVIEDACQAHGASRDGFHAGAVGAAAAFSFYPGKNLGAMGDAGALTTSDLRIASRARALREHGQVAKYDHAYEGFTARLDAFQAAVLARKLVLLAEWNAARRETASSYLARLTGVGDIRLPPVAANSQPVWHLFVIRTADPTQLGRHLAARGIQTGRHYPIPVHLSGAYAHLGYARGSFPVTESISDTCLSLPLFPGMSADMVDTVVAAIREYFDGA
jgi:dTDP-4-amino-4,6-dideoxygalactose transaminase